MPKNGRHIPLLAKTNHHCVMIALSPSGICALRSWLQLRFDFDTISIQGLSTEIRRRTTVELRSNWSRILVVTSTWLILFWTLSCPRFMAVRRKGASFTVTMNMSSLSFIIIITLRASCGAVYCNRSCIGVCGVGGWVCYHDNSKLRASILTKLSL